MTSHVKMCTNGYLFERLKVICLSYAFKINRMQFKWLRLLIQKNIPPCEWLLPFENIHLYEQQRFSIQKNIRLAKVVHGYGKGI